MVGLLIGRRNGDSKADVFSRSCHRRDYRQWLIHRPLGSRDDRRLEAPLVHIVASCRTKSAYAGPEEDAKDCTQNVRDEDAVELGRLEQFGKFNPVVDVVEAVRLIVRMPPEARRLVATAYNRRSASDSVYKN